MACTTISVNAAALRQLRAARGKGESYSDVIIRQVHRPSRTCGELLEALEGMELTPLDDELETIVMARRKASR